MCILCKTISSINDHGEFPSTRRFTGVPSPSFCKCNLVKILKQLQQYFFFSDVISKAFLEVIRHVPQESAGEPFFNFLFKPAFVFHPRPSEDCLLVSFVDSGPSCLLVDCEDFEN